MVFLPFPGKTWFSRPCGAPWGSWTAWTKRRKGWKFPESLSSGGNERNCRMDLWEGILGSPDIPGMYRISRGDFSPPALLRNIWSRNLGRMDCLGSVFLKMLHFPCREWQELAFLARPARRGRKESRWVGNFALKSSWSSQCLQNLLQYLGFPWNPVVPHRKRERREDFRVKIGAFTVSFAVFRE